MLYVACQWYQDFLEGLLRPYEHRSNNVVAYERLVPTRLGVALCFGLGRYRRLTRWRQGLWRMHEIYGVERHRIGTENARVTESATGGRARIGSDMGTEHTEDTGDDAGLYDENGIPIPM